VRTATARLLQIPMAYGLSRLAGYGPKSMFAAIAIAQWTLAVVSMPGIPPREVEAAEDLERWLDLPLQ
jgi:hypothetical protein